MLMFAGYVALVLMGVTLGLMGAGGSILTLPILMYFMGCPILLAGRYALVIVGVSATVGVWRYRHFIDLQRCLPFLFPSLLGVFLARYWLLPHLPLQFAGVSTDTLLLQVLLVLMVLAGLAMVRDQSACMTTHSRLAAPYAWTLLAVAGLFLGLLMGVLGVGGGFLIIPTLVLLLGFTMTDAIPASLFIIMVNAALGIAVDFSLWSGADGLLLLGYVLSAMLGMLIGLAVSCFVQVHQLRRFFGFLICCVAAVMGMQAWLVV